MARVSRARRAESTVFFYVPVQFDESTLPAELSAYADCARYLLHCIARGWALRDTDDRGYVRLKAAYLRRVIPDRVERRLRLHLIEAGVIEVDRHYLEGEKSMGYRFGPGYTKTHRIACQDAKVARRVRRLPTEFRSRIHLDVHRYLRGWYRRLEIDIEQARSIALGLDDPDQHMTTIDMVASGYQEFSYCTKGRVHTIVTRLPTELRPALRIDGERLVNVDIVNSQPLILALLLLHHNPGHLQRTFYHRSNPYIILHRASSSTPTASITMSIPSEQSAQAMSMPRDTLDVDARKYVELCEAGLVYDHLAERAGLRLSRKELKQKFYRDIFFGRPQITTEFTQRFEAEFPTVMALIRRAKRGDYTRLACLMQNLESSIVIDGVCRRLMNDHPEVPVLTIHDSILTTPAHVETVKAAMLAEFLAVGLRPKLKVEDEAAVLAMAA